MANTARLEVNEKSIDLPLVMGSESEIGIDISKLRSQTKAITLDPGFVNTGSCESGITYLDGENGILRYRGYPIEQLAEKSNFLEVSYLLIYGELPTNQQLNDFEYNVKQHTLLHEDVRHIYQAFPKDAHPMAILSSIVCALSTFYPDFSATDSDAVDLAIWRLMGKLPTIAAWSYKKNIGQPFVYPINEFTYTKNFLNMLFGVPTTNYEVPEEFVKALNVLFILHADHEQNCSTSTVRLVGSSEANLFASISTGIAALWGPLHGGANQAVLEMLKQIHNDGGDVQKFVKLAKDKGSGFRLMGFGHRVYKNFDPRATILKGYCDKILDLLGTPDPLLDIAKQLEEAALTDEYFIERNLYPNVDFYSGIIYKALGFPTDMFTVLFSLGRLPGWIAHWLEMRNGISKIGRPRQIYTGQTERNYVSLSQRN
ncbi:MAG TPA: citrate synthase [Candidatus Lambdaproteobacteria bacterium]|jgi:citrate synthase|uniref:Citrate synthase n=1 Tax=SAR324 cluster bacterium TaxID=2024889 RepID=A0A432GUX0_9DELT|nr:citrate synthase [SAR324 cluster bacterium]RTZ87269.1 MAG: citrate (Si)-synthase [SAR324 cluster bacterium]HHZ86883.1 citrate synthase [Candidatus Lambdaproteobacteria bacterium]HIA33816.1 citrate synthase [Candidatus Lambdaproteobacteria bacterium]HIC08065.1 citrate synthase [Candidatus Lambdaproteobacteria bacterium]